MLNNQDAAGILPAAFLLSFSACAAVWFLF
jgi:hypothetical protein